MPLAAFEPRGMGFPHIMYSLVLLDGAGGVRSYLPVTLFIITVFAELILIFALLGFKNRRRQMMLCSAATIFELLWVIAFCVLCLYLREDTVLHIKVASFFPLAAIILTLMARRMIKKDDDLVRSADRIR